MSQPSIYQIRPVLIKQLIPLGMVTTIGALYFGAYLMSIEPIPVVHAQTLHPQQPTIEIEVEWTEERIKKEIQDVFPGDDIMLAIAKCESNFLPQAKGPTNDAGVFQIHLPSHEKRLETLGLDPWNPTDNIKFARILYEESGYRPWVCYTHGLI